MINLSRTALPYRMKVFRDHEADADGSEGDASVGKAAPDELARPRAALNLTALVRYAIPLTSCAEFTR
jgi:hypothetical protein